MDKDQLRIESINNLQFPNGYNMVQDGVININAFRTNTLLRKDEWQLLDTTVVDIARARLTGVADLRSRGLLVNLGGLGITESQYEKQSDMTAADITMQVTATGSEDTLAWTLITVPVPVIHKGFRIDARRLEASRRLGQSLDVSQAAVAARRVADAAEEILFNGTTLINVNGNSLLGYTNFTDRNTTTGTDWGTITNIETDVLALVDLAEQDNFFGPYDMYVAKTQFGELRQVHTDGSGETAMDRSLRQLPSLASIKPSDNLADASALLIQMTRDVVDLALGVDVQTIQWDMMGGLETRFKVLTAMAPRIKSDRDNKCGVQHITTI